MYAFPAAFTQTKSSAKYNHLILCTIWILKLVCYLSAILPDSQLVMGYNSLQNVGCNTVGSDRDPKFPPGWTALDHPTLPSRDLQSLLLESDQSGAALPYVQYCLVTQFL